MAAGPLVTLLPSNDSNVEYVLHAGCPKARTRHAVTTNPEAARHTAGVIAACISSSFSGRGAAGDRVVANPDRPGKPPGGGRSYGAGVGLGVGTTTVDDGSGGVRAPTTRSNTLVTFCTCCVPSSASHSSKR